MKNKYIYTCWLLLFNIITALHPRIFHYVLKNIEVMADYSINTNFWTPQTCIRDVRLDLF